MNEILDFFLRLSQNNNKLFLQNEEIAKTTSFLYKNFKVALNYIRYDVVCVFIRTFVCLNKHEGSQRLTIAYDMLNAAIVNPRDKEELALTLNGKKSKIKENGVIKIAIYNE